jgi:hypothetical protein
LVPCSKCRYKGVSEVFGAGRESSQAAFDQSEPGKSRNQFSREPFRVAVEENDILRRKFWHQNGYFLQNLFIPVIKDGAV